VLASVFRVRDRILLVDFQEKDATINPKYYVVFLAKWSPNVKARFQKKSCSLKISLLLTDLQIFT
jgi:hypothetical protein